jgi:hypothetical protein
MTVSEASLASPRLRLAARRSYEIGRVHGALVRGTLAAALATPAFLLCNRTPFAAVCLAGLALVVIAGRVRGEAWWKGARTGAIAGILPCMIPGVLRIFAPDLCALLLSHGAWICALGGAAAGGVLGLQSRSTDGYSFWAAALLALAFAASLGCIPAGVMGFAGLSIGMVAGAAPAVASRRASV